MKVQPQNIFLEQVLIIVPEECKPSCLCPNAASIISENNAHLQQ
jgi:hypothetical protein